MDGCHPPDEDEEVGGKRAGAKAGRQEGMGWVCRTVHGLFHPVDRLRVSLMVAGPEEYFSKGGEAPLKIRCRDAFKSVFREIPSANRVHPSVASPGGRGGGSCSCTVLLAPRNPSRWGS